ncbi:hypothetical protein BH23THE1_BH23THE1_26610 [soil metagenome]
MLRRYLFRKLKDSKYKYPKITQIVCNPDMLLAVYLDSLILPIHELNIVWDKRMLAYTMKYNREIIHRVEKLSKEKGVKFRVIVGFNKETASFVESLRYCDKRNLANIEESFQISDNTACVVPLFDKEDEQLNQILLSNSKYAVERKQSLFNSLWKMATPIPLEKDDLR